MHTPKPRVSAEDMAAYLRKQITAAERMLADRDQCIERQRARYTEAYEAGDEREKARWQENLSASALQRAACYERLVTWRTALQHLTGELWS
jgi:hypothetical protein